MTILNNIISLLEFDVINIILTSNIIKVKNIQIKKMATKIRGKIFFFFFFISVDIYYYSRKLSFKEKILFKGKKYLIKCLKGKLNKKIDKQFVNPRVTIIIPVYNCQSSIKQTIKSIQNQKIIDIEIMLVNDKSNDESLKIIKNIQKTDTRIKIINNKKNMGTLFSRCIGVLHSKGKYIFPLDNDDMFFDDDIINIIFEEANNFNYDIVGFKGIKAYNYKERISKFKDDIFAYNNNFTIYQPKLSLFGISEKGRFKIKEARIWSKCIKNSIYKKAINLLGKKRYSFYIVWAEDTSMLFVLLNVAESYRYITRYGIFRLKRKNSACRIMPKYIKLFGEILSLDVFFDFSKNDFESKKFVIYQAIKIRKSSFIKSLNNNKYNEKTMVIIHYLKHTLKKIISCSYINKKDKVKLTISFKEFI